MPSFSKGGACVIGDLLMEKIRAACPFWAAKSGAVQPWSPSLKVFKVMLTRLAENSV